MRRLGDGIQADPVAAQNAGDLAQHPGFVGRHKPDIEPGLDLIDLADPEIGRLAIEISEQIRVRPSGRQVQKIAHDT